MLGIGQVMRSQRHDATQCLFQRLSCQVDIGYERKTQNDDAHCKHSIHLSRGATLRHKNQASSRGIDNMTSYADTKQRILQSSWCYLDHWSFYFHCKTSLKLSHRLQHKTNVLTCYLPFLNSSYQIQYYSLCPLLKL